MPSSRRLFYLSMRCLSIFLPIVVLSCSLAISQTSAVAQSSAGEETLDEAFSMKLSAKSTRDLDKVVELCENAMEEGLDEEGDEQAKQLAAAALYEHAEQLSQQILDPTGRDRRWQIYRRQALSRLKKATEYQPKMGSAWLLITKLHGLNGGDTAAAAVAVEKAIELAGDDRRQLSAALFLRARLAGSSGDEDTLLADLDQAIKIDPDNMDAYRVRGEYYLNKREPEKALEDLNRWLDSSQSTIGSILVVDRLILMGDKFDESMQQAALEILGKAIENDPKSPDPYHARARVHAIREDIDSALNDIEDALELAPGNDRLVLFQTRLLIGAERQEEASAAIDKFLEKKPDDIEMSELKLALLVDQSKYGDAIDQLRKLIRLAPDSLGYRRQLAALYNADDRPSQAIRVYSRLLDEISTNRIGTAGDEQKLALLSTRSNLLQGRGNARLSTGEHKEATADYDEALDLSYQLRDLLDELDLGIEFAGENSTLIGVLNNFAWVLATSPEDELRNGERAIELATEAAELTDFKEAYILSTLASAYAETGDFDTAMEWIDKAITENSKKAKTLEEEGDQEEAIKINDEQTESLEKEKASYVDKKPWREKQDIEEEKKAESEDEDDADSDSDDDDSDPADSEQKDEPADEDKDEPSDDMQDEEKDESTENGDDGDKEAESSEDADDSKQDDSDSTESEEDSSDPADDSDADEDEEPEVEEPDKI